MFILPKPKGIQMKNKTETVGLILLFIGVALLIFTFLSAYWFLIRQAGITAGENLTAVFGEALAPLIATCIRVMYLGIMAWIGSMLTLRGITLLTHPKPQIAAVPKKIQAKPNVPQKTQIKQVQTQPTEQSKISEIKPQTTPQAQPTPSYEPTSKALTSEAEKKEEETKEITASPEQVQETPQQTK